MPRGDVTIKRLLERANFLPAHVFIRSVPGVDAGQLSQWHLLQHETGRKAFEAPYFQGTYRLISKIVLLDDFHPERHIGGEPIVSKSVFFRKKAELFRCCGVFPPEAALTSSGQVI